MSYGFPIINFSNPGVYYEAPCIIYIYIYIYIYVGYILVKQKNKLRNHFQMNQNSLNIIMFFADDQSLIAKNNTTFGEN